MNGKTEDPYTFYNWQFLRRNLDYRAEYDLYSQLLQTDEQKAQEMLIPFLKRWGMSSYLDWRDENPKFLPNLFFTPVTIFDLYSYDELTSEANPIDNFINLRPGDQKNPRFLLMALDLERIRSKDYDLFWPVIKDAQTRYVQKKSDGIERVNSSPEHLDLLLATYDEHVNNPTANTYQIAQTLIHLYAEPDSNPSQHSRRVEENLIRAKKLISLAPNILFDFSKANISK